MNSSYYLQLVKDKFGIFAGLMNIFGVNFYHFNVLPSENNKDMRVRYDNINWRPEYYNPFPSDDILLNAPVYRAEKLKSGSILFQLTKELKVFEFDEEFILKWFEVFIYLYDNMLDEYKPISEKYLTDVIKNIKFPITMDQVKQAIKEVKREKKIS